MERQFLFTLSMILSLSLAACGSASEPTVGANDAANTAIAEAWMMVTLTQAAIPTPSSTITPMPATPTWTLQPTFTFVPASIPATLPPSGAADPCNQPPPSEPKGTLVQVQFINRSNGSVSLSFGMIEPNSLGECGTYSFSLARFDSPIVKVLAGCYWAYGWVSGENTSTTRNASVLCVPDTSQIWKVQIGPEVVEFK